MFTYRGALFYAVIWRAPSSKKCETFLRWALRLFYYIGKGKSSPSGLLSLKGRGYTMLCKMECICKGMPAANFGDGAAGRK